ncbi:MAG TPA: hypothetical protein VLI55_21125 [Bryobacteraceae bacterium]|nr:hypothetical protein [Bryobacteraceae bacterium]
MRLQIARASWGGGRVNKRAGCKYVFETIQHLIEAPADEPKRRIGFPTSRAGHEEQASDEQGEE